TDGLLALARSESVDLTIVGPAQPLVEGLVDRFAAAGRKRFGPTADAAQLEGAKAFANAFLAGRATPAAAYRTFDDLAAARAYVRERSAPIVVKADGLAAGKGVVVAATLDEADTALASMLEDGAFGSAGRTVVVEEFLRGEEAS